MPTNGELKAAVALATGWEIELTLHQTALGGTAALNWDESMYINPLSPPAVRVTIQSPGYNNDGTASVVTRTLYVTDLRRKAVPNEAQKEERNSGGDAIITATLNRYIRDGDTITKVEAAAGWYTGAIATTLLTGLTNNSTVDYKKALVNPLTVPNQRVTSTLDLLFHGGHWSAENGQPWARLEIIVTDEALNSVTDAAWDWTVDWDFHTLAPSGALPSIGIRRQIDVSSLADGELTVRWKAYPYIGDSDAIFDSELDKPVGLAEPNQLPFSKKFFKRATPYGGVARVGVSAGASPTVYPEGTDPLAIPSNHWFGGAGGGNTAAAALRAYANSGVDFAAHDDAGGGNIFFDTGAGAALFASNVNLGTMKTWLTFQPTPGHVWTITSGASSSTGSGDKIRLYNFTVNSAALFNFKDIDELWIDRMTGTASSTGPFNNIKVCHVTRSTAGAGWAGGFKTIYSSTAVTYGIFRANNFSGMNAAWEGPQTISGCVVFNPGSSFQFNNGSATWDSVEDRPGPDWQVYGNSHLAFNQTQGGWFGKHQAITSGLLVYNVTLEGKTSGITFTMCSDTGIETHNVVLWHILCRGLRNQWGYEFTEPTGGTVGTARSDNQVVNSIVDVFGNQHDTGGTPSGNRILGWSVNWRVEHSCLIDQMLEEMPTHGNPEVRPVNSHRPNSGQSTARGWAQFSNDQAYAGGGGDSTGGNYHLAEGSPINAAKYRLRWVLSLDQNSEPRSENDPAGPLALKRSTVQRSGIVRRP